MTEGVILLAAASVCYMLMLVVRELHVMNFTLWRMNLSEDDRADISDALSRRHTDRVSPDGE